MEENLCNISLDLGLGCQNFGSQKRRDRERNGSIKLDILFPTSMTGEKRDDEEQTKEEDDLEVSSLESKDEEKEIAYRGTKRNHHEDNSAQKKLRLTKNQSTVLEDSFRKHQTLNSTQKHELAKQLNILPRQVEVWFQNKRARTKLKQTEVDYGFFKKCCENLRDENRRLKKELQELRSLKPGPPPFCIKETQVIAAKDVNISAEELERNQVYD